MSPRIRVASLLTSAVVAVGLLCSPAYSAPDGTSPLAGLHNRALAALPEARAMLDAALTDYPTARFRDVRARLVRSVYADDEGQSNKVPWTHRGGLVLVFCGEFNSKNRMGGYTGWGRFAFQPSQTDIVTMFDFSKPRQPTLVNLAEKPQLRVAADRYDREVVELLCDDTTAVVDPADLAAALAFRESAAQ